MQKVLASYKLIETIDEPISKLNCEDLKWKFDTASTESHTFYCSNENNEFAYFQLAYAKVSGITNIQISYAIISKERSTFKTLPSKSSSFKIEKDGFSAKSDNISIKMSTYKNNDICYMVTLLPSSGIKGSFLFQSENIGGKVGNNGTSFLGENHDSDYMKHYILPDGKIQGCLKLIKDDQVINLNGRGSYLHAVFGNKPYSLFNKSVLSMFFSDDITLIYISFYPLKRLNSSPISQSLVVKDHKISFVSFDNGLRELDTYKDKETDYQIPTGININLKDFNQDNGHLEIEAKKLTLISKIDILGQLPFLLRKIIQLTVSKPFLFMYYQPSTLTFISDGERTLHSGNMYTEISFI